MRSILTSLLILSIMITRSEPRSWTWFHNNENEELNNIIETTTQISSIETTRGNSKECEYGLECDPKYSEPSENSKESSLVSMIENTFPQNKSKLDDTTIKESMSIEGGSEESKNDYTFPTTIGNKNKDKNIVTTYVDRNYNIIEDFKEEMRHNQYIIALSTFNKLQPLLFDLQTNLSHLLSKGCRRQWKFSYLKYEGLRLRQKEENDFDEICDTTQDLISGKIRDFEKLVDANRDYRIQTASVTTTMSNQLEILHQEYQRALKNSFDQDSDDARESEIDNHPTLNYFQIGEPTNQTTDSTEFTSRRRKSRLDLYSKENQPWLSYRIPMMSTSSKDQIEKQSQASKMLREQSRLSEWIEKIETNDNENRKMTQFYKLLAKTTNMDDNWIIFKLGSFVKNSLHAEKMTIKLKPLFPHLVQCVLWSQKIKLIHTNTTTTTHKPSNLTTLSRPKLLNNGNLFETRNFTLSLDSLGYLTTSLTRSLLHHHNKSEIMRQDWKLIPIENANYFLLFHVDTFRLVGVQSKEIFSQQFQHRDLFMTPSLFHWRISFKDQRFLTLFSRSSYLFLNLAENGLINLSKDVPGLFSIE